MRAGQVLLPAGLSPDNDILQVSGYIVVVPVWFSHTEIGLRRHKW